MISFLWPPAQNVRHPFRRLWTGHSEAQTSTTAACRVPASIVQISPEHSPLRPPSPPQTAQLAACRGPVSTPNALKSP